jgi:4'-phosphopantetheinyl transferase
LVQGLKPSSRAAAGLSAEEAAKARLFRFQRDQERYIHAHIVLREILAAYLSVRAADLDFELGCFGKPRLAYPHALKFSLSTGRGMSLVGVSRTQEVGVDLENLRTVPDAMQVAATVFTQCEYNFLARDAEGVRDRSFLRVWTRKEALVKATGQGLLADLKSLDVSGGFVRAMPPCSIDVARWRILDADCGSEHIAAVATERSVKVVRQYLLLGEELWRDLPSSSSGLQDNCC